MQLIIGASGLLGTYLSRSLFKAGIKYIGTKNSKSINNLIKLDLQDKKSIEKTLREINPSKIYIASALTDVDKCEKEQNLSYNINYLGIKHIIDNTIKYLKTPHIIYYSTEYVFSANEIGPFKVTDKPNPSNIYGKHKLCAENYIKNTYNNWTIIRTCNIYGDVEGSKNFALTVLNNYRDNKEIIVRRGQIDTPTYAKDLALFSINEFYLNQVIHYVSFEKPISRYDFAKLIIEKIGYNLYGKKNYIIKELEYGIAKRPNYGLKKWTG